MNLGQGNFSKSSPHYERGRKYLLEGQFEKAEVELLMAINDSPQDARSYYFLARAYTMQGKSDEAIKAYLQAIEIDPRDSTIHKKIGDLYFEQGRYLDARQHYEMAIKLEDNVPVYYSNLSTTLLVLEEIDAAISVLVSATGKFQEEGLLFNFLGHAYLKKDCTRDALTAFTKAVSLEPEMTHFHKDLGDAYLKLADEGNALACYEEELKLNPENQETLMAKESLLNRPKK